MSRSYRHTPMVKDSGTIYRRFAKRQANKKVRKYKYASSGMMYKKIFETWDIFDYVSYFDEEDLKSNYRKNHSYFGYAWRFPNYEDGYQAWRKDYYWK